MINRQVFFLLVLITLAPNAQSATRVYSLHIGVNQPPAGSALETLQYADDDALRFFSFMRRASRRSTVAAAPDSDTQKIFSKEIDACIPQRSDRILEALSQMKQAMQADRKQGDEVVFIFSYAGHGFLEKGTTWLTLLDGKIDSDWLEKNILSLPADYVHLFIDACHAQGLLGSRGAIKSEKDARSRPFITTEVDALVKNNILERYPNAGALVASSTGRETHEWSRIQSGVFTHELLSGLSGAADVNGDGEIAYSEVAAFISAANRSIDDPRASVRVLSKPPKMNANCSIVSLAWFDKESVLRGGWGELGHFYIEAQNGTRLLDAHLDDSIEVSLVIPAEQVLWLWTKGRQAKLKAAPGEEIVIAALDFKKAEQLSGRGASEHSIRKGFFKTAFGRAYYQGFIGRHAEPGVTIPEPPEQPGLAAAAHKQSYLPAVSCLVSSSAALIVSTVFTGLAIKANRDFDNTTIQKEADELRQKVNIYQGLAIGSGVLAAGLGIASWLLWPADDERVIVSAGPVDSGFQLVMGLSW
jgi:hypothetical protein